MAVLSPLTGSKNIKFIEKIQKSIIIDKYLNSFNINVEANFKDFEYIDVYECVETGLKFFYPTLISAEGELYEKLQSFDWYYLDWKWEYEVASKLIESSFNVLEIGSGNGNFIDRAKNIGANVTGLELNESIVKMCRLKGLNVLNQNILEHSLQFNENYDVVCSFQVMEHISNVREVIEASLRCLKKGGSLVISVPNNDSFIKFDKYSPLNLPPHHMNLWNEKSLKSICDIFNIKIKEIFFEPLQPYHFVWYQNVIEKKFLNKDIYRKIYFKLRIDKIFSQLIESSSHKIQGHSILAIFEKTDN